MASKSASGTSIVEREAFLKDHGFFLAHSGKGSHAIWENPELKALAKKQHIDMPANLKKDGHPWEITLCSNPKSGTWRAVTKQAEWVHNYVEEAKGSSAYHKQCCKIMKEFRQAVSEVTEWKDRAKKHFKAGIDIPAAPKSYHDIESIVARKKNLSFR